MLDLSKLKALELPTEEIEIEILGEKQSITITCPPDTVAVEIAEKAQMNSADTPIEIIKTILIAGMPDVSKEDIAIWLEKDFKSAAEAAAKVRDLMGKFAKLKEEKRKEIEKNSSAAELTKEQIS
jgi:hypothetical protein